MGTEGADLDEELLDGQLERLDLRLQLRALVGNHRGSDDRTRHTAGSA